MRPPGARKSWGEGSPSKEPLRALFMEMERAEELLGTAASDRAMLADRSGSRQLHLYRKRVSAPSPGHERRV